MSGSRGTTACGRESASPPRIDRCATVEASGSDCGAVAIGPVASFSGGATWDPPRRALVPGGIAYRLQVQFGGNGPADEARGGAGGPHRASAAAGPRRARRPILLHDQRPVRGLLGQARQRRRALTLTYARAALTGSGDDRIRMTQRSPRPTPSLPRHRMVFESPVVSFLPFPRETITHEGTLSPCSAEFGRDPLLLRRAGRGRPPRASQRRGDQAPVAREGRQPPQRSARGRMVGQSGAAGSKPGSNRRRRRCRRGWCRPEADARQRRSVSSDLFVDGRQRSGRLTPGLTLSGRRGTDARPRISRRR